MARVSYISNFKKLPYGLLLSLLIIALFFALINTKPFWLFILNHSEVIYEDPIRLEAKLRLEKFDKSNHKVLFIGSSQAREAIDAKMLASRNPKFHFNNLGTSAMETIDYMMIRKRIADVKPQLVVIVISVSSFYREYDQRWLQYFSTDELLEYSKTIGMHDYFSKQIKGHAINKYSSVYRMRNFIRRIFFRSLLEEINLAKPKDYKDFAYNVSYPQSRFNNLVEKSKEKQNLMPTQFTGAYKVFLIDLVNYYRERGIDVVLLDLPTHEKFALTYDDKINQDYYSFLENYHDQYNVSIIYPKNKINFTSEDFNDMLHMSESGRLKLTNYLSEYISRRLP